jgi:hypothetical protein
VFYFVFFPHSVVWAVGASVWKPLCCILLNLGVDLGGARCLGLHLGVGVSRIVLTVDFRGLAMEVSVFSPSGCKLSLMPCILFIKEAIWE